MKIYKDKNGQHSFDDDDNYAGYTHYEYPEAYKDYISPPFDKWEKWDKEKHKFLTEVLEFSYELHPPSQQYGEGGIIGG